MDGHILGLVRTCLWVEAVELLTVVGCLASDVNIRLDIAEVDGSVAVGEPVRFYSDFSLRRSC